MKKRNWYIEEKMAGISGKTPMSDISRNNQISQTLCYRWRDKFLEGGKAALSGKIEQSNSSNAEIEKLQKIIGKQTVQIEILKKPRNYWGKDRVDRQASLRRLFSKRLL